MRSFPSFLISLVPLIAALAVFTLNAAPRGPISPPNTKKPVAGAIAEGVRHVAPVKLIPNHAGSKTAPSKKGECCRDGVPCSNDTLPTFRLP